MADGGASIYVFRDAEGEIIYVGCTVDLTRRLTEHRCKSPWWDEVAQVDHFDFADEALARERERDAIRAVRPRHNFQHAVNGPPTGSWARRVHESKPAWRAPF